MARELFGINPPTPPEDLPAIQPGTRGLLDTIRSLAYPSESDVLSVEEGKVKPKGRLTDAIISLLGAGALTGAMFTPAAAPAALLLQGMLGQRQKKRLFKEQELAGEQLTERQATRQYGRDVAKEALKNELNLQSTLKAQQPLIARDLILGQMKSDATVGAAQAGSMVPYLEHLRKTKADWRDTIESNKKILVQAQRDPITGAFRKSTDPEYIRATGAAKAALNAAFEIPTGDYGTGENARPFLEVIDALPPRFQTQFYTDVEKIPFYTTGVDRQLAIEDALDSALLSLKKAKDRAQKQKQENP